MNRFVSTRDHSADFAVSEIVRVGPGKKYANSNGYYHVAPLRDGREIVLDSHYANEVTDAVVAIIPALPGYSTIETGNYHDSCEPYTIREPVIVWQVRASGEMRPVTMRGPNNGNFEAVAIEQPSGEIWCPREDAIYRNFDDFREAELEWKAAKEAARAIGRTNTTGES
ncbi:hypothetical protein [Sphingomonas abietis]|uniref:Uncharacterized protein n=1 Tax=Sphingomonas abietis TaxID=3012344 RepID=A0ABY7NNY8_9SPHN|nr:hypothetical protein [Sphingomonas abietis]WBO22297.1 hypothetical protein PBT88_19475 [Sphingomonas abietis]